VQDEEEGYQDGWYLDRDEQARLLSTWERLENADARQHAEKWLAAFAIGTRIRQGELAALHIADVHVDDDTIACKTGFVRRCPSHRTSASTRRTSAR
jgi:integrase